MSCSLTATHKGSQPSTPGKQGTAERRRGRDIHTDRRFDELSPGERESFMFEIESEFRDYMVMHQSQSGFVYYPNTRQITKAISIVYETLADIDFSDILD